MFKSSIEVKTRKFVKKQDGQFPSFSDVISFKRRTFLDFMKFSRIAKLFGLFLFFYFAFFPKKSAKNRSRSTESLLIDKLIIIVTNKARFCISTRSIYSTFGAARRYCRAAGDTKIKFYHHNSILVKSGYSVNSPIYSISCVTGVLLW